MVSRDVNYDPTRTELNTLRSRVKHAKPNVIKYMNIQFQDSNIYTYCQAGTYIKVLV